MPADHAIASHKTLSASIHTRASQVPLRVFPTEVVSSCLFLRVWSFSRLVSQYTFFSRIEPIHLSEPLSHIASYGLGITCQTGHSSRSKAKGRQGAVDSSERAARWKKKLTVGSKTQGTNRGCIPRPRGPSPWTGRKYRSCLTGGMAGLSPPLHAGMPLQLKGDASLINMDTCNALSGCGGSTAVSQSLFDSPARSFICISCPMVSLVCSL